MVKTCTLTYNVLVNDFMLYVSDWGWFVFASDHMAEISLLDSRIIITTASDLVFPTLKEYFVWGFAERIL